MRFQEGSVAREEVHLQFYEASARDAVEGSTDTQRNSKYLCSVEVIDK